MNEKIKLPELLCPAGSAEAFSAAIEGGADAIYVGGTAFNARMNAKNFTKDQLSEAIKLAHSYGVKVYVAANTLIYDNEIDSMLRSAEDAYLCGADALIVADVGAATMIKKRIPIDLHGSTQMSGHNVAAAEYMAKMGLTRMVCAREMSREDLRTFTANSPIEAEVFVHGALCVCHSGQCLFSSLVGGRSGNRGECAQPCRLPFKNKGGNPYPLSLKDLSLAEYIPELIDMKIASLKIEGRMKSPEYVRDVARVWRRLLDEGRGATKSDMRELAEIFSRGGFTDGYYKKNIDSKMLGVRSEENKQTTRELTPFEGITKKTEIEMLCKAEAGQPMELKITKGDKTVTVCGAIPEKAINTPITAENIKKNLSKLGNTPYVANKIDIEIFGEIMVPVSAINALRRAGIDALSEDSARSEADFCEITNNSDENYNKIDPAKGRSAYFHFPEQIPKEAYGYFDVIYLPVEKYDGRTNGIALPPVIFDGEKAEVERLVSEAKKLGCQHILVENAGHFEIAKRSGMKLHGGMRLNVANSRTAAKMTETVDDVILCPELTLPKIRDIIRANPAARVQIYGRTPLMITEKCVGKEVGDCRSCESGRAKLTDRRGVEFPILKEFGHRSVIVNSVPTYMADRADELKRNGIVAWHFVFTTESAAEAKRIIESHKRHAPANGNVRRIK